MTQPANRRLVTEDRFLVTEAEAAAAYDAVTSIASLSPNYIINGAFEINQRAFTSTTTNGTYGFDRWLYSYSGGTSTYSAQIFTLGAAPVSGYEAQNYARVLTTGQSAAGDYTTFQQRIESVRTLAGQTATISFWAKAASGTPKIAVDTIQNFGTGGSPSANVTTLAGQVTLSTSWARYSVTVNLPSISGKTIGTTAGTDLLQIQLWLSAGSTWDSRTGTLGIQNNTIDIWGVQVERGSVATTFRRNAPSIQGELAACQRYYQRFTAENSYGLFGTAMVDSPATAGRCLIPLKITMRAAPSSTLDWSGTASHYSLDHYGYGGPVISGFSIAGTSKDTIKLDFSLASAGTAGQVYFLQSNNNGAAFLGFSAEL